MSNSLPPHGLQHVWLPCPSPSPGAHSDSCPSSPWSPCSHLILGHPLLLLPPIPPSIRIFSNESTLLMRWPKYWSFSFSIIPSKEIPGLICLRMDWLDLLEVQGTLKSLLHNHHSKASILWHSVFFIVQLSHPYMSTGKTIALTIQLYPNINKMLGKKRSLNGQLPKSLKKRDSVGRWSGSSSSHVSDNVCIQNSHL